MRELGGLAIGAEDVNWGDAALLDILNEFCDWAGEDASLVGSQGPVVDFRQGSKALLSLGLLELAVSLLAMRHREPFPKGHSPGPTMLEIVEGRQYHSGDQYRGNKHCGRKAEREKLTDLHRICM